MTEDSPYRRERRRAVWVLALVIVVGGTAIGLLASNRAECSGGSRSVRLKVK